METDDYFAKMMFSSINTEAYFECNDDSPSTASDYGINSVLTEKALTSHRKTLPNPVIAAQKSEANKLNQLISSQTSCGLIQSSEEVILFTTYLNFATVSLCRHFQHFIYLRSFQLTPTEFTFQKNLRRPVKLTAKLAN